MFATLASQSAIEGRGISRFIDNLDKADKPVEWRSSMSSFAPPPLFGV
jgi:hypothetical protein